MRLYSPPLLVKRAGPEGRFTALASTYDLDRQGDRIAPGAFARSLAALKATGGRLPLLWNHSPAEPIGAIEAAEETDEGLEVAGVLALDTRRAQEAFALLKTGALSLSIGFTIPEGGAHDEDGVRVITDLDLAEISVVGVPANPGAVVRDVKSLYPTARDLERALRDRLGLSNREAKRLVVGGYEALAGHDHEPDPVSLGAVAAELDSLSNLFRS